MDTFKEAPFCVVVKTRSVWSFWDKSARCLMTGWAATGVEGA
jgi:hypothetical protein